MGDNATYGLRAWLPLIIVSGAVLTAALDHTVVVTVLPEVMPDLKVPPTELDRAAWIITAYLLGFTAAIPVTARLADVHGHARLYQLSLVVFGVGSLGAALAPNLELLIAARTVQAIGGGATIPVGMAMAVQAFPGRRRAVAVGIIGACAEAGMVLGPLYGGVITNLLGWRWVFWLDVPQAIILIWLLRGFPTVRLPNVRMDWVGGALLVAGLSLLVYATAQETAFDVSSPLPYALGGVGAVIIGLLVWSQGRAGDPLLPPEFFRSREALAALVVKLLLGASLIMAMVTVPLMANTVLGQSPLEGGLRLMRMTGAMPVGALLGGFLTYRLGERAVTMLGLGIGCVGLFLMSGWTADIADPGMTLHLAVAGFGFGLVIAPGLRDGDGRGLGAVPGDVRLAGDHGAHGRHDVRHGGPRRLGRRRVRGRDDGARAAAAVAGAVLRGVRGAARRVPGQRLGRQRRAVPGLLPHLGRAAAGRAAARDWPQRTAG